MEKTEDVNDRLFVTWELFVIWIDNEKKKKKKRKKNHSTTNIKWHNRKVEWMILQYKWLNAYKQIQQGVKLNVVFWLNLQNSNGNKQRFEISAIYPSRRGNTHQFEMKKVTRRLVCFLVIFLFFFFLRCSLLSLLHLVEVPVRWIYCYFVFFRSAVIGAANAMNGIHFILTLMRYNRKFQQI